MGRQPACDLQRMNAVPKKAEHEVINQQRRDQEKGPDRQRSAERDDGITHYREDGQRYDDARIS